MYSMELNLQIRHFRQQRGYTLAQLADMVNISGPHLSEVERGKKNVNNHLLERLSSALNVKPADLIQGSSLDHADHLAKLVAKLTAEDQQKVDDFARALLLAQEGAGHKEER